MGPNWNEKGNAKPEKLPEYDWAAEYYPLSHPVRAVPTDPKTLIDYDTGEVIAILNEGYSFFWAHNHLHVCKTGWDGETYPEGWPEKKG